ncbi:pseudouridine synthase [Futiania mangrovi]|uniref:Pseudouridine synthase n=1 Tax=Futiania mangrovi TaxID=2959716 RepID=A0A9J6PAY3_9PROT|nr:pseudouridine synthase [Futiania mangrovii]MCP1334816.1 rRNA pseudouridine synthase [Futiania mangrovii]
MTDATDKDGAQQGAARGERIAKVLARAGIASRRAAEAMIAEGRVAVNGRTLETPATLVTTSDRVEVDGKPLPAIERPRLWRYHKPRGLVVSAKDPEGRQTVFEALPPDMPRVVSVGRLDLTSEGLLLLTNDGGLSRLLELPATGWSRRYRVRVFGDVDQAVLDTLLAGVEVEGVRYGPITARLERVQGANAWIAVTLKEGKNREIRRVMEHLGLKVTRLIRTSYGPFQLGKLEPGEIEEVPRRTLVDQVGAIYPPVADAAPGPASRSTHKSTGRPKLTLKPGAQTRLRAGEDAKAPPTARGERRTPRPKPGGTGKRRG